MKTNKVIWVTGASSGLGRELALDAGKKGYTVVLLARNKKKLLDLQKEMEEEGQKAYTYPMDMSNPTMIVEVSKQVISEVGIDVLINNAGFGVFDKVENANIEDVQEMFAVNVVGLIALTKEVLPHMQKNNRGHIINIASQAGKLSTPKSSVYAATKHAVLGFTNGLRMELMDTNIKVTAVNPGPIKTPFFERADQEGSYVQSVERWMLQSDEVARKTIQLIESPRRELNLPKWMHLGSTFYQVFPSLVERIAGRQLNKK
ncbi:3-oxoacyl-[acyl-carrier protein] reductase [Halalkalibacter wakoensis JCM 9140]|uniref:3-oxoacyl-[acyl-carrier protein] reductase n=1 Tax=Halalkalibacter wakoensis JCM 9140 TaxID=1236970 RepID=W4PYN3_9BACI|nr:SDR family oxidoreductase [Halalkalibacter wakoensis]GAE24842.1 3-oxoacyl-[acyl-carrier protein] reductase [Halalkalibacter wakoensis JCM 9140]